MVDEVTITINQLSSQSAWHNTESEESAFLAGGVRPKYRVRPRGKANGFKTEGF